MERAFRSDLCCERFDSLDNLNADMELKHKSILERKEKFLKCNFCDYRCRKNRNLISHTRTHTGERPFKCEVSGCGVAFAQAATLRAHIKFKHSDERPFKCDFPGCLHTDKTSSHLRNHKKVHSDEGPLACPNTGCSFIAKSNSAITRHIKGVHSNVEQFVCPKCDYKTARNYQLKRHMLRHSSKRDFKCSHPQCTASFKYPSDLKRHLSTLHRKKNIQCDRLRCGHCLASKAAYKDHRSLHHPSVSVFQCPLCFKHFTRLDQLQTHCVVHTNEKPFQCGHCTYEATTRANLKSHISLVHAAIPFPFIVHLLDDRECLHCKMTLPSAEFLVHCKDQHHVDLVVVQ